MKILLIGEYSNLHNSLKEGLLALGHQVTLVSSGDSFKKFPSDYSYEPKFSKLRIIQFVNKIFVKLRILNFLKIESAFRFYKFLNKKENYDVIQLINSDAVHTYPFLSRILYRKLFRKSKNIHLLVCGDEVPIIEYYYKDKEHYNILTSYFQDKNLRHYFDFSLKYLRKEYQKLFQMVFRNAKSLITSDFDYETPMRNMGYETTFVPNPINTDKIIYRPNIVEDKIIIFLGINRFSYYKKGICFFEEALQKIKRKYAEKVEVIITENVPYQEYIMLYEKAHILLDQIYAYDQGYNALTAMAQGKVVFTGAGKDWQNHFGITEDTVAIDASPNADIIYEKLEWLIQNPEQISKIGKNAREFVEKEHHYIKIAERYLQTWTRIF